MDPTATLTADEVEFLAGALVLGRYVNHDLLRGRGPTPESEARAHVALAIAKKLGIFREYWDTMQRTDVLSIRVKNLDAPRKGTPRKGPRPGRPSKYAH